ncbi:MAG TPA: hypothetical protein VK961_07130 [Chthoniobacter sp.]|nr:hypothetical protein [Chthoniobacter sp.]
MSTVSEIEDAIERLPQAEREALESRLLSRRFGLDALDVNERAELLASIDEAEREIESGSGITGNDLRRDIRTWIGK